MNNKFINFYDLTINAANERRSINLNNICKYGVKILDEYL